MSNRRSKTFPEPLPATDCVRCAVYTRKSTEEGLEKEFNSLDAQREAGAAYVASQRSAGWVLAPDRYDDGGFTGGNTDRPALQRLLADIDAGRIDAVIVYKVDRLSRSLLDFTRLMAAFDEKKVAFVSVTQQFNTATSMGRLVRNGRNGGAKARNSFGALLKGLLRCRPCNSAMTTSHTTKGTKRYRYYRCSAAEKNGHHTCPSRQIPAGAVEGYVVSRIRAIGRDSALVAAVAAEARAATTARLAEIAGQCRELERTVASRRKDATFAARDQIAGAQSHLEQLDLEVERLRASEVSDA